MEVIQVNLGKKQKMIISLFALMLIVIFVSVINRVYIDRDYLLMDEVDCDPGTESCFKRVCEECSIADGEYEFYKKRFVSAKDVPVCNPTQDECPELACEEARGCQEEYCNEANVPDGEECSTLEDGPPVPDTLIDEFSEKEEIDAPALEFQGEEGV